MPQSWKSKDELWKSAPLFYSDKSPDAVLDLRKHTSLGIGWREATEEEIKSGYLPQNGVQQLEIGERKLFIALTFNALSETDQKNTIKEMIVALGIKP